jgi:hypothetical protein
MGDPFMELRAVLLLEFGCPPLPIASGVRQETNQPVVINSHDLLSTFMAQAYKQKDAALNASRRAKQEAIEEDYFDRLLASDGSFASVYEAMRIYTRDYLATYLLPPYRAEDVIVLPPEYISPALAHEIGRYHDATHIAHFNKPAEQKLGPVDAIKKCHWILCQRELRHRSDQAAASSPEASA